LSGPLAAGESVQQFIISGDSQRVLYSQGARDQDGKLPLLSVLIGGGAPATLPAWFWIHPSADGQWILYGTKLEGSGFDLYSVPAAGGIAIKLNQTVPTDATAAWALVSPDSRRVVYATSKDAGAFMPLFNGLYEVSIEGGEPREITGIDGQERVSDFFFVPDGQTLLAEVDYDSNGKFALYAFTSPTRPAPQK
jgi:hypothetical protein